MAFEIENGVLKEYRIENGVTDVVIPDGVTSIGERAFAYCESLTSITIPDGVTSIGDDAFDWCSSLTSITIPDGVTSIGDRAFSLCSSLTSITIPDSVTSIGESAFSYCTSLTSITIPDSVTSIGERAFDCCENLTSITIPDGVTSIGESAFEECRSLTSITIPDGVTSIGESAFDCCENLTSVMIPDSVTSIGEDAFRYCSSLISINISENNKIFSSVDGVVFNKEKTTILICPNGKKICTIPDNVTSIDWNVFERGQRLKLTEKGCYCILELQYYRDSKKEERSLASFWFSKDLAKREEIFKDMKVADYKLPLAILMAILYENDEFFHAYVKRNIKKAMRYLMDYDDLENIEHILKLGYVTKKNIDEFITQAIDNKQQEIYLMLTEYKDKIGAYKSVEEQFKL